MNVYDRSRSSDVDRNYKLKEVLSLLGLGSTTYYYYIATEKDYVLIGYYT